MAESQVELTMSGGPHDGQTVWVSRKAKRVEFMDGAVYVRNPNSKTARFDEKQTLAIRRIYAKEKAEEAARRKPRGCL